MAKRKTPAASEPKRVKMIKGPATAWPFEDAVPTWEAAGWTRADAQHKDSDQ